MRLELRFEGVTVTVDVQSKDPDISREVDTMGRIIAGASLCKMLNAFKGGDIFNSIVAEKDPTFYDTHAIANMASDPFPKFLSYELLDSVVE